MKILICGSEGSLMQAVIPKLIADGHEILGLDNLKRYGKRLDIVKEDYEFRLCNLLIHNQVEDWFRIFKPDVVIQAAALIYGVGGFNKYCADILGQDISLHNNVIRAAVRHNVKKIVYMSSSMVYECCPQDLKTPVTEDMPEDYPAPKTEYGLSKFTGERLTKAVAKQYGLSYTIWRPFNIITPYEQADEQEIGISHVFADFMENIIIKKQNPLHIIGNGQQIRCFTWIDDIASGIADNIDNDVTDNEIFNLGNPEPTSMIGLALIIQDAAIRHGLIPDEQLNMVSTREYPYDVQVRVPNINKARKLLLWNPTKKVQESVDECVKTLALRRQLAADALLFVS